jgi:methionine salvage enolase-phosphatase E1
MEAGECPSIEALEVEAAAAASLYEDVVPALGELKQMGVRLQVASSLSHAAVRCFVEAHSLGGLFDEVWDRESAGGIKSAPLARAARQRSESLFLTDTLEGMNVAREIGVHPILMMNDPDEARRLAMHGPVGGIVSLHELPDFVRLVRSRGRGR